ncbi:MAG: thiamine pyrophosphate-binding protein, partial [Gammaproteobacteria bacterium]
HQQGAVLMSLAQNFCAGRMASAVMVSAGPAITNAMTGILVARDNHWPALVIGMTPPLSEKGFAVQELDAVPAMAPLTKWSAQIDSATAIAAFFEKASAVASSGRCGPVYLQIPGDVKNGSAGPFDHGRRSSVADPARSTHPGTLADMAHAIYGAQQPLAVIGECIRWSAPYRELRALIEHYRIPFVTSHMAKGSLPDDHPLCFNAARHFAQHNADSVILIGARLNWTFRYGADFRREARIMQFDSDATEPGYGALPRICAAGDITANLKGVLDRLASIPPDPDRDRRLSLWHSSLENRRMLEEKRIAVELPPESSPMSQAYLADRIVRFLPDDAVLVLDGNKIMFEALPLIRRRTPASLLTPGTNACMGVGVPFGIGAKFHRPDRPVFVLSGDFSFGLNGMEIETAVKSGLPIIVIVANNKGMHVSEEERRRTFCGQKDPAEYGAGIRYDLIAEALGGRGEFVSESHQLIPALQRSLASGKATVINVTVA